MTLESVVASFGLVAVSEMGDKTQLLAFSLAARFKRPMPILLGIFVATVLNHSLAAQAGQWVASQIGPQTMAWILAALFVGFGIWTLKPDELDEQKPVGRWGAFGTTTVLFFLAEMGDKTQMATVALAARYQSAFWVTVGTTLGMMVTDGAAVWLGEKLSAHAQNPWIRRGAAALFILFGIASAISALR